MSEQCDICSCHPQECPTTICAPCALSPRADSEIPDQRDPAPIGSSPESVCQADPTVEEIGTVRGAAHFTVAQLSLFDSWSPKRLAWAFGCAKNGSEEERVLFRALKARLAK